MCGFISVKVRIKAVQPMSVVMMPSCVISQHIISVLDGLNKRDASQWPLRGSRLATLLPT